MAKKEKKKTIHLTPKPISKKGDIISVGKTKHVGKATKEDYERARKQRRKTKISKRKTHEKVLDVISAPLSKPKETFTKGLKAGGEAVAESREKIKEGDGWEAAKVIGTTLGTTALAGGAVLGAGAIATKLSYQASITLGAKYMRSTMGLLKMSGKAGTLARGKLVAVPGRALPAFGKNIAVATRYAANPKSASLTKKILIASGISLGVASITKDLLGTYPFASFGKEETLQSISFAMTQAINAGLYEEAQGILDASNEIVNATPSLVDKIPYANVQKEFTRYATQQAINNKVWQEIIDKKIQDVEEGSEFDKAREERKAEDLEEMKWKAEYYNLIREGKYEEAEELLEAQG